MNKKILKVRYFDLKRIIFFIIFIVLGLLITIEGNYSYNEPQFYYGFVFFIIAIIFAVTWKGSLLYFDSEKEILKYSNYSVRNGHQKEVHSFEEVNTVECLENFELSHSNGKRIVRTKIVTKINLKNGTDYLAHKSKTTKNNLKNNRTRKKAKEMALFLGVDLIFSPAGDDEKRRINNYEISKKF